MKKASQNLQLKDGYFKHVIKENFLTKSLFFFRFMPLQMNKYEELKKEYQTNWKVGMIEKATLVGNGWIGVQIKSEDKQLTSYKHRVKHIDEEFLAYKIIGDYSQLREVYGKIMKDYPQVKNYYNLYLTDPKITKKEENIAYILFN
jgi:hypothetical protein